MDFQSAMETFAEAWVAANAKTAVLDSVPHQVSFNFFFNESRCIHQGRLIIIKIR